MNGTQFKDGALGFGILAAVGLVAYTVYSANKAIKTISENVQTDPEQNLISRGADATVDLFVGKDKELTVGDRIFRYFNPADASSLCKAGETQFCTNSVLLN